MVKLSKEQKYAYMFIISQSVWSVLMQQHRCLFKYLQQLKTRAGIMRWHFDGPTWQSCFATLHVLRQLFHLGVKLSTLGCGLRHTVTLLCKRMTAFLNVSNSHILHWNALCLVFLDTISNNSFTLNTHTTNYTRPTQPSIPSGSVND